VISKGLLGFAFGVPVGLLSNRLWQGDAVQEGVAQVPYLKGGKDNNNGAEVQVYYKVPFASPPHLTFLDNDQGRAPWRTQIEVVEQKPDSFKIRALIRSDSGILKMKWCAEGVPAASK